MTHRNPRKIEHYVYDYDDLPKKARGKAVELVREKQWHMEDSVRIVSEDFKIVLKELGLPTEVGWSLNYSQGDGMAFWGSVNLPEYAKKNKLVKKFGKIAAKAYGNIEHSGHYYHWNSMGVRLEASEDLTPTEEKLLQELEDYLNSDVKDVSKRLEKRGYALLEDMDSDTSIEGFIRSGEFEFNWDGSLYSPPPGPTGPETIFEEEA